ncbi:chromosomal replication initiator protein DnaA [Planctomicrobium sp. SH668]|uniref:chromosomal replication initiator protein DnaA n=1 Tax=Planctomicrobium sp. SH668 TaxID=3448126 RepID=UPI003F5C5FE2
MLPVLSSGGHDNETVLNSVRQALLQSIGVRRYQNWFGGATQLELNGARLTVHVQSPYMVKWVQKQFESELLKITASVVGPDVSIDYEVGAELTLTPIPASTATEAKSIRLPTQKSVARKTAAPAAQRDAREVGGRAKRIYSLNDIVVGEANELPMAAVQHFIQEPGTVSPLYIHGSVGNGKTHLLEGIRNRLRREYSHQQVLFLTAEQFGNYYTQALAARSLPSFRAKFRGVDVLLVDDVDFFDGKKGFQEEFLHTLKQFEVEGRQVALTAIRHPRLLTRTSDELVSRFLSGIVARIEVPTEKMRLEIVSRHATRMKARFTQDSMEYVAARFTNNVRELEGAVNVLATWSQMTKNKVTISSARQLLGRLERDCLRLVRVSDIENAVCEFFGVPAEELKSSSRKRTISQPRMLAMYLSRKMTQTAYSEIGHYFGGRNHSTVMSAEKKVLQQITEAETIQISTEIWTMQDVVQTLEDRIKTA